MATLPGTEPALDALPLTVSGFQKELQAPSQSTLLPAAASWSDAYSAWPLESTRTLPAPPISSTDTVFQCLFVEAFHANLLGGRVMEQRRPQTTISSRRSRRRARSRPSRGDPECGD